jgi:hypothetical protein
MEHKILEERPDPKDYDLQPYGYIVALTAYIDNLEAEIKTLPRYVMGIDPYDKNKSGYSKGELNSGVLAYKGRKLKES